MVTTGSLLAAAGFDVRVPALSRRKPTPSLRVFADAASDTVVGANQLVNVRWTALFDDVELTAADIARLAKEARPLLRSRGRWVAVDQADLQAAAAALAEQGSSTQLSGAEMLRLALGLEGSPLEGGVSIEGGGWAADLLAAAANVSDEPASAPAGFVGELRSYQAEALAWLGFLDSAGLGGCLALDMGLGKTPTMLAHLLSGAGNGPALVIAPAAVVGNWAAEAAVRAGSTRGRASRHQSRLGGRDRRGDRRRRRRDHDVRHRGARRRRHRRHRVGACDPRRGASDQEPGQRHVAAAPTDSRRQPDRAHRHTDRERPGRPVGHPRLHQPRARGHATAVHRPPLERGRLIACSRRRRAARAQRHPRVPAHEGRARDRGGAPRPDRRARSLRDDRGADRAVPGGARHAGGGHRRRRG